MVEIIVGIILAACVVFLVVIVIIALFIACDECFGIFINEIKVDERKAQIEAYLERNAKAEEIRKLYLF